MRVLDLPVGSLSDVPHVSLVEDDVQPAVIDLEQDALGILGLRSRRQLRPGAALG